MSEEAKPDMVNHPAHYNKSKYEHVVVAENWEMSTHMYCATKYMCRCNHKDTVLSDLQKSRWYIIRMQEQPWTALVEYPLRMQMTEKLRIGDVASDWFPNSPNLEQAMVHLGLVTLMSERKLDRVVLGLVWAVHFVDREYEILKDR